MQRPFVLKLNNPAISNLLSASELSDVDVRCRDGADQWLKENFPAPKTPREPRQLKEASGRKSEVIDNPFYGFIGFQTDRGRYPSFASDIIEGIARLDWHDREINVGGKSMPLSVRSIALMLEQLPIITNELIQDLLELQERHARRYVVAMRMIIPRMMKCRPTRLHNEMDGIYPEIKSWEWEDDGYTPTPEELAKLHYDLRTLTEFKTAEQYELDEQSDAVVRSNIIQFPQRKAHPKRQEVSDLLAQGVAVKAIERATGVTAKTIRSWRDQKLAA